MSNPFSDPPETVPDGIEPVVGWRYWRADEGWLCSVTRFKTWPARTPLRARCSQAMDHGPLPGERCGCGIYAAADLATLQELLQPEPGWPLVVGEVALWGKVIPAQYGFRAELAYPRRLWVVEGRGVSAGLPASLQDRYGVPASPAAAAWALGDQPANPWRHEPRVGQIRQQLGAFQRDVERLAAALAEGEDAYRRELDRVRAQEPTIPMLRSAFRAGFASGG